MDKTKKIAFGIGTVLAVLAAFIAPAMAGPNTVYFVPRNSSAGPDETIEVDVLVNITDPYGYDPEYAFATIAINVTFDSSVGDIISCDEPDEHPWDVCWMKSKHGDSWYVTAENEPWDDPGPPYGLGPGIYPVANFTIKGVSPGEMDLLFDFEQPRLSEMVDAIGDPYPNQSWVIGTFKCTEPAETFEKELVAGWNLISLPLIPSNNSTSAVLGNDTIEYDAVYRYNATSKQFEDVTTGTMDPGIGYFVNVTTAGTWSYEGTPYTSMSIPLKRGLNLVGWLNCTKQISGNLSSIAGEYNYIARWNAGYEVYEPHAPEVFNDFFDMERGNGYWIAAKEDCKLEESCSG